MQKTNNQSSACRLLLAGFLFRLFFDPEDGYVPLKRRYFLRTTWRCKLEDRYSSMDDSLQRRTRF
jgi:hypothetical protein